jgi:hypothetical protein
MGGVKDELPLVPKTKVVLLCPKGQVSETVCHLFSFFGVQVSTRGEKTAITLVSGSIDKGVDDWGITNHPMATFTFTFHLYLLEVCLEHLDRLVCL